MVAEVQEREFAKDHIYSGCKRTKELSATGFCNLSKQKEKGQKKALSESRTGSSQSELKYKLRISSL